MEKFNSLKSKYASSQSPRLVCRIVAVLDVVPHWLCRLFSIHLDQTGGQPKQISALICVED